MSREQVVFVTGAAGNLGAAVTAAFRATGARLVLVERSRDKLVRAYGSGSPDVLLERDVDLADPAAWDRLVARATERFGRIDALVHTVGAYRGGRTLAEEDLATWSTLFDANVRSALLACRAVLPGMLARGHGRIVTVASRDALTAEPGAAAYSAMKAAVLRMTESLAAETRRTGVTANCILPAAIDTPQNRASLDPSAWPSLVPGDAIADVITFLTSPAARAVSGAAIPVYGA
ncbi:MAG: SDR family NAD(P)-dependent oxidoreductase [Deltaproteobacteria bacterium]|nr:SDR family NAD(P)-dependent oxidoreductase [Deltaproteobacteria bacterium]